MMPDDARSSLFFSSLVLAEMATQSSHIHPFANSRQLLEVIPNKIDVEEESRLYDELCVVSITYY